jgi:hypothetical protein
MPEGTNSQRMTPYSGPLSMFGAKVQIAALEKALDFELVMAPYTARESLYGSSLMLTYFLAGALFPRTDNPSE